MLYTIYKITNLINGKFYIGKHQTNDLNDDYFGSGKILRAAIKKHGLDNFKKEILEVYDQEWKMNLAEKIYVVVDQEVSYNICPGGKGGWGYVNHSGKNVSLLQKNIARNQILQLNILNKNNIEQKRKASLAATKQRIGKCWIKHDNLKLRMFVLKEEIVKFLPLGWSLGTKNSYTYIKILVDNEQRI